MKKLIRLVAFYFGILLIFQSFARADAMEDWLESGPARGVPVCAASFVFLGNFDAKTEVEKSNFNKIGLLIAKFGMQFSPDSEVLTGEFVGLYTNKLLRAKSVQTRNEVFEEVKTIAVACTKYLPKKGLKIF